MGLRDQLAGVLPADLLAQVSDHFSIVGDIAILSLPPALDPFGPVIARAVVSRRRNIRTVLNRKEKAGGDSRISRYEILLGENTSTTCREFGFSYRLDVSRCFFSPRMASERRRVHCQVLPGERVYVPFAGVGPFVIPAAARGAAVYATEKNPDAFRWLGENIRLNHVVPHCHIRNADASDCAPYSPGMFDRLIIPAPYGMDHALDALLPLLSRSGIVHFYTFKAKEQIPGLNAAFAGKGLAVRYHAPCGNVAPGISRWVFDMARIPGPGESAALYPPPHSYIPVQ